MMCDLSVAASVLDLLETNTNKTHSYLRHLRGGGGQGGWMAFYSN